MTGYVVNFNLRHKRQGHLLQNRESPGGFRGIQGGAQICLNCFRTYVPSQSAIYLNSFRITDAFRPRVIEKSRGVGELGLREKIMFGNRCAAEENPKSDCIPIHHARVRYDFFLMRGQGELVVIQVVHQPI